MPARFLHRHKRLTFTLVVIVCLTLFLNYGPWSARGTFARIVTEEVTQRVDITYDSGNTMHYLGLHADPDGTVIGRIRPTSSQGTISLPERVFRDCPRGCSRWESPDDQSAHAGLTHADDVDNAVGGNFLHLPTFGQPTARDLFLQAIAPDARCITRSRGGVGSFDVVCINQKTGAFLYRLSEISSTHND